MSRNHLIARPRRNRKSEAIRSLVQENFLRTENLVAPFFILPGDKRKEAIDSLPGIFRLSLDLTLEEIDRLQKLGLKALALFPVVSPSMKNVYGSEAINPEGEIPKAIKSIKEAFPSICLIADVALDPYTSHGHDGVVDQFGYVQNDGTVEILKEMSLIYAEAGVDFVAPSDMMDGRIGAIRDYLDANNFCEVGIVSYTAKYASSLYSPFREALGSHLAFGDKKTYQMNPANGREALRELYLDEKEGADAIMIKPALFYLDIISKIRQETTLPICAFHVSGEYAMVMAAHDKGFIDADKVFLEALLSIKRAGADFIFTYAAPRILSILNSSITSVQ